MRRTYPAWGWKLGGLLAALALMVGLAACGGGGSSSGTTSGGGSTEAAGGGEESSGGSYFIGSTQDLSGPVAGLGVPNAAGFESCADKVNEEGGVNGKELDFEVLDDQSNPEKGLTNMKTLLAKNPVAFVNQVTSDVMVPVNTKLNEEEIPGMGYAPVEELVKLPYFYSMGISTLGSYNVAANWIAEQVGGKKPTVAIMGLETPAGVAESKTFASSLEKLGWKVLNAEPVSLTAPDASSQAHAVAQFGAEYVIVGLLANQVPVVVKALQEEGVKAPIINFAPTADDAVLKSANSSQFLVVRDFTTPSDPHSEQAAEMREAAKAAGKANAEDLGSTAFTKGWATCKVFVKALEICGAECDGKQMKESLDQIHNFSLGDLAPPISFSKSDRQGAEEARVVEWDPKTEEAKPISEYLSTKLEAG